MLAAVPKPKPPQPAKATPDQVQTAFRLPVELLAGLDALVEEANRRRSWPRMTRSDLVRLALARMVEEQPEWLIGPATNGR